MKPLKPITRWMLFRDVLVMLAIVLLVLVLAGSKP